MLTDVAAIAESTFDVKRKELMARAVARRVIKKATVYAAKDSVGQQDPWASLAMDAAGVLWEASESAETRCWGLLPREIQISRRTSSRKTSTAACSDPKRSRDGRAAIDYGNHRRWTQHVRFVLLSRRRTIGNIQVSKR